MKIFTPCIDQQLYKTATFDLVGRSFVKLELNPPDDIKVIAQLKVGDKLHEQLIAHFKPTRRQIETFRLDGFDSFRIESKNPTDLVPLIKTMQSGEPIDDLPVPEQRQATNHLARIRRQVRDTMATHREAFLALAPDNSRPGYEVDDDDYRIDEEVVEDDLLRQAAIARAAKEAEANPPAQETPPAPSADPEAE